MMRFKLSVVLIILLATFATAGAQENKTDAAGMKQGAWVKKYSNGNLLYEGVFKDNKPVGVFKRYSEDGKLQSLLTYDQSGRNATAVFYHPNGKKAAEGSYSSQKKEGLWKYYSSVTDEYIVSEDNYKADQRDGLSRKLYPSGAVAETLSFIKGIKEGEWAQYYDNGKLCLKGFYVHGRLDGPFVFCYPEGNTQLEGQYLSDMRVGKWKAYNQDGSLKYETEYINGKPADPSLAEKETKLLDELEKNKGKILDPEMTGNEQQ